MVISSEMIGYLAGVLVAITMIPQIVHSLKTKSVQGLSFLMLLIFCSSMFLWFIYGLLITNYPLMITNGFATLVSLIQLYVKIKYR